MNRHLRHVVWYRFKTTFGRRWRGHLALALLIGLTGGIAIGALSAARRTQSSFSTYLTSTNPSDLSVSIFGGSGSGGGSIDYSPSAMEAIAHLPGVKHVERAIPLTAAPLRPDGTPRLDTVNEAIPVASDNGLFFHQDRLAVTRGRMAIPDRSDEIVMTAAAARLLGFRVGQVIPYGIFTTEQTRLPGIGTPSVAPHRRIETKLVGLVVFSSQIVQDDIDRLPGFVFFTPALGQAVLADSGQGTSGAITYGLQLDHGNGGVAAVEREFSGVVPPGTTYAFHTASPVTAKVNRTVEPLAVALGVFGAIAALAALLIGVQIISRQLRDADEDMKVLRALGASPMTIAAEGLIGILAAIGVGSVLAAALAAALSPLSPLGPVRRVYPGSGIAFDWTVLGIGLLVLIAGLAAIAVGLAYRAAPHRVARRSQLAPLGPSKPVQAIASTGLPAPAVVGVRFALDSGRGRAAVPVRSALLGAALAVMTVTATLAFGSGLQSLVSHPALYGWNWDYMLNPSNSNVPPQALALLDHNPDVAGWTGYDYNDAEIDGQTVAFLFEHVHPEIGPPILAGHALANKDQIVLGAATLAQLHKHIGDTVVVTYGKPQDALYVTPTRLTIVGTATMPAVGFSSIISDHTSMGTGALVSFAIVSAAFQQAQLSPDPTLNGPNLVFVRLRHGISHAAGLAVMQRIADVANRALAAVPNGGGVGSTVAALAVQRPAEIVNYRTMGATPALLASGLAAGAILALGLTLTASVRRRRHDLALLKTLGFTKRQLAATVAWQASIAAVIGIVVGVPLGIAIGRQLWILFAHNIDAVPQPTVPVTQVVLVALGAIVLANLVAALPGRNAARTPAAQVLRTG
ncbi:MAG: hypothetical protein JWO37_3431 [Acidimicrobiales bacterium]|nr:hypothetical protein [Acidimicrobiales bacterium]